jgi:hypothetical protein
MPSHQNVSFIQNEDFDDHKPFFTEEKPRLLTRASYGTYFKELKTQHLTIQNPKGVAYVASLGFLMDKEGQTLSHSFTPMLDRVLSDFPEWSFGVHIAMKNTEVGAVAIFEVFGAKDTANKKSQEMMLKIVQQATGADAHTTVSHEEMVQMRDEQKAKKEAEDPSAPAEEEIEELL